MECDILNLLFTIVIYSMETKQLLFTVQNYCLFSGDHVSGKPVNVREFDSYQGNVRDFTKSHGKNLAREKWPKTVYCKLHICIHTDI